jgi:group I intron endonuclease
MTDVDTNLSGIYTIRNKSNGKFYVGSAVHFRKRWELHRHQLRNNKHDSRHLQHAWNKYGEAAFEFSIVELCDKVELLIKEQAWIKWLEPDYNICKVVANSRLGVKSSPEHIAKIVKANTGQKRSKETCIKIGLAKLGTKASEETIAKLKLRPRTEETRLKIGKARLGKRHSEEAKEKMSAARKATALRKSQEFFANMVSPL